MTQRITDQAKLGGDAARWQGCEVRLGSVSTEIGCLLNVRFFRKWTYRYAVLSDVPGH